MKKVLGILAVSMTAIGAPQLAHADDFGCTVLLCLANPAGPMAVAQCVPPITQLYRMIFSWRPQPFPTCVMSNGLSSSTTGNFARVGGASYYDACPTGTTALAQGTYAAAVPVTNGIIPTAVSDGGFVAGIGDGSGYAPTVDSPTLPPKICVGNLVGSTISSLGMSGDNGAVGIGVYDQIIQMNPANSTFNVEVYINGVLNKVVRPF